MKKLKFYQSYNLQWFGKDGPGGEKTEPATAKKLKDARGDGKVAKSKELSAGVDLLVLFMVLKIFISYIYSGLLSGFNTFYKKIPDVVTESSDGMSIKMMSDIGTATMSLILQILAPVFLIGVIVAILINLIQVKWKPTTKPMQPKLSKMDPLKGFKKILSMESLFELVKSIAKIVLIVYVAYVSIKNKSNDLFLLYEIPLNQAISLVLSIVADTGLKISMVYLVLGLVDFIYQKHKFTEDMKMSKQEVKDEFKNSEGNPEIKGRQRQRMREVSQRRMMQDVPKADVIITNPTHLSIALQYNTELAKAPIVVAKGEDYLALKIREIAKENNVEIIENKALARMLYANVDIGAEVPPELYQAVAEVLAMVYSIKNG